MSSNMDFNFYKRAWDYPKAWEYGKVFNNIPIFNWIDLNGKILKINTSKDKENIVVAGYEECTGITYVLYNRHFSMN
jgi:hypothetical protein